MWTAKEIKLIQNDKRYTYHNEENYTLKIDSYYIRDNINLDVGLEIHEGFEQCICNYCGYEGCNSGGFLCIRKKDDALFFIPSFLDLDSFEQREPSTGEGESGCPSDDFYVTGILKLEKDKVEEFKSLLPNTKFDKIRSFTEIELILIEEWERRVIEQPKKGFRLQD